MTTSPATRRRDLLAVLTVALLARLLVPIVATVVHDVGSLLEAHADSPPYLGLAESLTGGHFTRNGAPEVLRTPGYPLFVALGVFIGHPIGLTILLQVILGSLAAVTVYALAEDTTASLGYRDSRRVALLAGLFYALDPLSIIHSSFVLSETLFTTLLLAHLYILLRYFKTGSLRYVVMSGALAVAAIFVRPAAMYWPFVVGRGSVVLAGAQPCRTCLRAIGACLRVPSHNGDAAHALDGAEPACRGLFAVFRSGRL